MAQSFVQGWIRPGVYVQQTAGPGAATLPSSFISTVLGHGSDRFQVVNQPIVSGGAGSDVLDSQRNVASIIGIRCNNIAITSGFSVANQGALPFGTANIAWASNQPAAGKTYVVTYIAYKNPAIDYAISYLTDLDAHLNYFGQPSLSTNKIVNGSYLANSISMGAAIEKANGATAWYAAQLNSFDESTLTVAGTLGSSTGATGPTGSTATALSLSINGEAAQAITLPSGAVGATMAAAIQAAVQALSAVNPVLQAAYDEFTCVFSGDKFILTSGMVGDNSAVVVSAGTLATALNLGTGAGGTEHAGTGPTLLDLTTEPGLYTATQQALAKLELVDTWVIVHCFPAMIGADNASLIPLIKSHVLAMRDIATQKFRVAMVGAKQNTDTGVTNPEAKYIATAAALGDKSLGVVAPSTTVYTYGKLDYVLDGWAIAAAVAGIMTNPAQSTGPIAGKPLVGFSSIKDVFNTTQKNSMGAAGMLMIDNELSVPAIIQDLTTDQSNAVNAQFKFTRAADYVSKSLRLILRKLYINTDNLGGSTLSNIGTSTKMILQQMVYLHILADFADPVPTKNATDSREVDLALSVQLVPDISWLLINLGINI